MPVHDWTRVDAGLFHAFRFQWSSALLDTLNNGVLPPDHFALLEQRQSIRRPISRIPFVATGSPGIVKDSHGGLAVAEAPPQTRLVRRSEADIYAAKADLITVRHRHGDVVAVIEIVSPGNKASRAEFLAFVQKSATLIRQNVNLLVIDLFPPGPRDPQGIHKAVWDEFVEEEFELPTDKPLTLGAYDAGPPRVAYVEPIAVGDALPDMPIFLRPDIYVPAPLDATYQTTWSVFPAALKGLLEGA